MSPAIRAGEAWPPMTWRMAWRAWERVRSAPWEIVPSTSGQEKSVMPERLSAAARPQPRRVPALDATPDRMKGLERGRYGAGREDRPRTWEKARGGRPFLRKPLRRHHPDMLGHRDGGGVAC